MYTIKKLLCLSDELLEGIAGGAIGVLQPQLLVSIPEGPLADPGIKLFTPPRFQPPAFVYGLPFNP